MEQKTELYNAPADSVLIVTREFNASLDIVFKMCTELRHFEKWWGPNGFKMKTSEFDLRPGGVFHYCMLGNGMEMWGKFVYLEIVEPEKIVFINSFSDKDGNTTRAPFSATWPLEVMNVLTLTEDEGKTTLTLRGEPHNATEEERKTFEAGIEMINNGFAGTFAQLDNYLDSLVV